MASATDADEEQQRNEVWCAREPVDVRVPAVGQVASARSTDPRGHARQGARLQRQVSRTRGRRPSTTPMTPASRQSRESWTPPDPIAAKATRHWRVALRWKRIPERVGDVLQTVRTR